MTPIIELVKITQHNQHIHLNLAQIYEANFAPLTNALPDIHGQLHQHTTRVCDANLGYLFYINGLPSGFIILSAHVQWITINECFLLPYWQKKGLAYKFLSMLSEIHPGIWDIRQIEGAEDARRFWRNWATSIDHNYIEDTLIDDKWGLVTRQLVTVPATTLSPNSKDISS